MAALAAAKPEPEVCEVYPENWPVLLLFLRLQTCWRIGPTGEVDGLRYPEVDVVIRRGKVADADEMFELMQAMEFEVIKTCRESTGG